MTPTLAIETVPVSGVLPGMTVHLNGSPRLITDVATHRDRKDVYIFIDIDGDVHYPNVTDNDLTRYPTVPSNVSQRAHFPHYYNPTIGTDPEVFVTDANGHVLPAFQFLPAKDFTVFGPQRFYDGFQAEFTTNSSLQCLGVLTDEIHMGLRHILSAARKHDPNAKLSLASVLDIDSYFTDPSIEKHHFALGCAPSRNAYNEDPLSLDDPRRLPFRFAGWHMHFRQPFAPWPEEVLTRTVRTLDNILGVAMVSALAGYTDPRRRQFYGRAGEYRFGNTLEYRVPDVAMGAHPAIFNLLWDLGRQAFHLGRQGFGFLWVADENEVRTCINTYDVPLARRILQQNMKMLQRFFKYCYVSDLEQSLALQIILEGMDVLIADPWNLEKNWKLDRPSEWHMESNIGHLDRENFCSTVRYYRDNNSKPV